MKDTTLLEYQIASLRKAGVDRVVVVLGHQAERLEPLVERKEGVTWVLNADYAQGKTTSIKAGLKALTPEETSAILVLNVDQPRSPETIRELLQTHLDMGSLITRPTHRGKGGHPIMLSPELLAELGSIDEENQGIKAVVQRHGESTYRPEMGNPEVLWDLNTPEQYEAALRSGYNKIRTRYIPPGPDSLP